MTLLIVIQIIISALLIVFVLLQHSDNEGLGFGGGTGLGGLMSASGSANVLSKATAITATGIFHDGIFAKSLILIFLLFILKFL